MSSTRHTPSRLYVSDLDGTLLDERARLSERSRAGLSNLLDAGILLTVATARSYHSIRDIFGEMPFRLPIVEFNGGFLTDYESGRHLEVNALGKVLSSKVLDHLLHRGLRPYVTTFDGEEDHVFYDEITGACMQWYLDNRRQIADPRLERVPNLYRVLDQPVVSMTIMEDSREAVVGLHHDLKAVFSAKLRTYFYENAYCPGSWWLTIHHRRASKHHAIQRIVQRYAPGARVVAFGDNLNDLEMMKHADHAVAVENAVPDIKSLAHRIIGHHGSHSVVEFLEQDFARGLLPAE